MNRTAARSVQAQERLFRREARASGLTIHDVHVQELASTTLTEDAARILRLAVLREAATPATAIQIYQLESSRGPVVYLEPFHGMSPLPGEFHLTLPGNFKKPVAFYHAGFRNKRWIGDKDENLEHHLNAHPALAAVTRKLKWRRHLADGYIDLDWTVQLAAQGDGTSHLVFQTGNYGALRGRVGQVELLGLIEVLAGLVVKAPFEAQGFYYPCYADLARELLGGAP